MASLFEQPRCSPQVVLDQQRAALAALRCRVPAQRSEGRHDVREVAWHRPCALADHGDPAIDARKVAHLRPAAWLPPPSAPLSILFVAFWLVQVEGIDLCAALGRTAVDATRASVWEEAALTAVAAGHSSGC